MLKNPEGKTRSSMNYFKKNKDGRRTHKLRAIEDISVKCDAYICLDPDSSNSTVK